MENVRNRIDVKLVNNEKKIPFRMYLKTRLYFAQIFNYNLVKIHKSKVPLKFNQPQYIGMCILELSKVLTHEIHYDYIKKKFGDNSKLLFTDAHSLMYGIKTEYSHFIHFNFLDFNFFEDVHEDFSSDREMFDFINYFTKPNYYDDSNKLVIGKMLNKTGDVAIDEFFRVEVKNV